jgi:hypothetical protein
MPIDVAVDDFFSIFLEIYSFHEQDSGAQSKYFS